MVIGGVGVLGSASNLLFVHAGVGEWVKTSNLGALERTATSGCGRR